MFSRHLLTCKPHLVHGSAASLCLLIQNWSSFSTSSDFALFITNKTLNWMIKQSKYLNMNFNFVEETWPLKNGLCILTWSESRKSDWQKHTHWFWQPTTKVFSAAVKNLMKNLVFAGLKCFNFPLWDPVTSLVFVVPTAHLWPHPTTSMNNATARDERGPQLPERNVKDSSSASSSAYPNENVKCVREIFPFYKIDLWSSSPKFDFQWLKQMK